MKFLTILAALAITASAVVIQVDVEPDNTLGQDVSLNSLVFEEAKCLPLGSHCGGGKKCCSGACRKVGKFRRYRHCVPKHLEVEPAVEDEPESSMKCRKNGASCTSNARCCSGYCKSFKGGRKQCAARSVFESSEEELESTEMSLETEQATEEEGQEEVSMKCRKNGASCTSNARCCSGYCKSFKGGRKQCAVRAVFESSEELDFEEPSLKIELVVDNDDEESSMKCRKNGASCTSNARCCSGHCKTFRIGRKQCVAAASVFELPEEEVSEMQQAADEMFSMECKRMGEKCSSNKSCCGGHCRRVTSHHGKCFPKFPGHLDALFEQGEEVEL